MLTFNNQENHHCLNCGNELTSKYCANCGQAKIVPYSSFWYIIREFLANLISFDAQVIKTLKPLLCQPGKLTAEYSLGKRANYIHPIKLYVFTSIVFFLLFPLITNPGNAEEVEIDFSFGDGGVNAEVIPTLDQDTLQTVLIDSMHFFQKSYPAFESEADFEMFLDTVSKEDYPGPLLRSLIRKSIELESADLNEVSELYWGAFIGNIPKMLFFLLPIFALLMQLLHIKKPFRYEEHLIFALHFHTFLFFLIILLLLLGKLWSYFWVALPVMITVYFFVACKTFFKEKGWTLALKGISMMIAYFIVFVSVSLANSILAFLQY
jgi:hypothetical protein